MDHALERIATFYRIYMDDFIDEQETGNYKKLSDNPYYEEIKALIASMNPLREFLGYKRLILSDEVKLGLAERERRKG